MQSLSKPIQNPRKACIKPNKNLYEILYKTFCKTKKKKEPQGRGEGKRPRGEERPVAFSPLSLSLRRVNGVRGFPLGFTRGFHIRVSMGFCKGFLWVLQGSSMGGFISGFQISFCGLCIGFYIHVLYKGFSRFRQVSCKSFYIYIYIFFFLYGFYTSFIQVLHRVLQVLCRFHTSFI